MVNQRRACRRRFGRGEVDQPLAARFIEENKDHRENAECEEAALIGTHAIS
jgi:hypothetical protein